MIFPATTCTDGTPKTTILDEQVSDDQYKGLIELQRKCEFYKYSVNYKLVKEVPEAAKKINARYVVAEP